MSRLNGYNADGTPVNFNDLLVRNAVADFAYKLWGYDVISNNNNKYDIDLISINGDCPNIECERANVKKTRYNPNGDYWENKGFSEFLRNATPNILYKTLNYQARKDHFWIEGDHFYENGTYRYTEKNHLTNLFIRTNFDFTQFMVICPETIRNPENSFRAFKKPHIIHKNELEPWVGYRRKFVDTYNLINGVLVLDTQYKESNEPIYKGYLVGCS